MVSGTYRSDIDGLRAFAVLAVVAFHSFPGRFAGGFVGVDVFFVISGFLITGIIFQQQKAGTFSFLDFYARRIRRIFPALALVLAFCAIVGWVLLLPFDFRMLGKHIAAGAGFVTNFVLLEEQGYFDTAAEIKPLLHLWSLAVEEQFYLFAPLMMFLVFRWKNGALFAAVALFLASFSLNILLKDKAPIGAFYLPVTRFWELMPGAILAIILQSKDSVRLPLPHRCLGFSDQAAREAASVAGALLLVLSLVLINRTKHFPGWWALMPVFGAVLLIGAGPSAWINRRVLSHPLLVYVGLISYPLYLWHWPMLVAARMSPLGDPTAIVRIASAVISFGLASLTYHFVERPIRFSRARFSTVAVSSAAVALMGVVGFGVYAMQGFPGRFPGDLQIALKDYSTESFAAYRQNICFLGENAEFSQFAKSCDLAGTVGGKKMLVWGDSHAAHLTPGLREAIASKEQGFELAQFATSSCPPLLAGPNGKQKNCLSINESVFSIINRQKPDTVVLAAFWDVYYHAYGVGPFNEWVRGTINRLRLAGVARIVVVGQFPRWVTPPPQIIRDIYAPVSHDSQLQAAGLLTHNLSIQNLGALETNKNLAKAAKDAGADFISPTQVLCSETGCPLIVPNSKGVPMQWDTDHLTIAGSNYFVQHNLTALFGPNAKP